MPQAPAAPRLPPRPRGPLRGHHRHRSRPPAEPPQGCRRAGDRPPARGGRGAGRRGRPGTPARRPGRGAGRGLRALAGRRGVVPRAALRRAPELPGRRTRAAGGGSSSPRSTGSLDTFDQSVGGTFIERRLIEWTAARIGFGPEADGVFTSGGSQSNLQGLLLARGRHERVDAGRLRILASAESHFSVQKSARLLGLGDEAVISVPTDERHRLDPVALERSLAACVDLHLVPMAIVATAGTTDFGAIDPLPAIADLARAYDAWLHVDAAYGGGLLVSPTRRSRLDGIDRADSVTIDFHKTFFQPVSSSAIVVRDRATLRPATWYADYLNPRESTSPNQVDKSLQTTRRFDALKALDDPAHDGSRPPRRVRRRGDRPRGRGARAGRRRAGPAGRRGARAEHPGVPLRPARDRPRRQRARAAQHRDPCRGSTPAAPRWSPPPRSTACSTSKLTLLNPMATAADIVGVLDAVRTVGARLASVPAGVAR
ncbi:aminotransferase class V-fold PLP-dependent enzyme [Nocardioides convexus]|uniref:pyridoxal phosphate-dependent decarboxylase family protein n=1 Tax=Nocardioides convexus TaxID=2712224 RepID=UPI0024186349|nr:aminotransferase class V-fold PLP-dependent enzyme [Nocardioides convexus]